MSKALTCPSCATTFRPAEDMRGKKLLCPTCRRPMVVTGAGIAKRDEGGPMVPAASGGRSFPWGWLAAALLLGTAAIVALLATRRPESKEEEKPVAAKTTENKTQPADTRGKLRPFVPGTPEEKPAPKLEPPPAVAPEPEPKPASPPPSKLKPPALPVVPGIPTASITYRFQNTLAAEEKGVPDLVATDPLRRCSFETATVFGHTQIVYRFSGNANPTDQQAGLTFDNSRGLINKDNYSIELVFVFLQNDNQWRRIVDVEDRQSDNGFYADPSNHLQIYPFPGVGALVTAGTYRHVVLAVSKTGLVKAYMDGGLQFTANTTIMNISNPRNVVHFFLDNTVGPGQFEFSDGKIALLRLYNSVLDDDQVARLATAFRGTSAAPPDKAVAKDAAPDPGTLVGLQNQVGQTYLFRVTGSTTGPIWGTGIYTADSTLATAAVHAGVLRPGETGVVRVRIVAGRSAYAGSTRNGVASGSWNAYPGAYTISRATPAPGKGGR